MRQQETAQHHQRDARQTAVLVVENDPAIRGMLRMMLDLEGYAVQVVAAGAEALRELRAVAEPRVVLVNQLLPDVDGRELLATAAAHPRLRRHRYVLMSTCAACGAHPDLTLHAALLPKPFSVEQLLDMVEDAATHLPASQPSIRPMTMPVSQRPTSYAPTPTPSASIRIATMAAIVASVLSAAAASVAAINTVRARHASAR